MQNDMRDRLVDLLYEAEGQVNNDYPTVECVDCIRDEVIKNLPTVDVVPVVRCKNCKHKGWVQEPSHGKTIDWCKLHDICIKDNDYCSYGERKCDDE
jgi:hypothetical protein